MKYKEVKELYQKIYDADIFDKTITDMSYHDKIIKGWFHLVIEFRPLRYSKKSFILHDYIIMKLKEYLDMYMSFEISVEGNSIIIDIS